MLKAGFLRCISLAEVRPYFLYRKVFGKRTPRRRALALPSFLGMVHWQSQPFSLRHSVALSLPKLPWSHHIVLFAVMSSDFFKHSQAFCPMPSPMNSFRWGWAVSEGKAESCLWGCTGRTLLHLADLGRDGTFTCLFMPRWSKRVAGNGKAKELSLWFHLPGAYGFPGEVSLGWEGMHQSN